MQILSDLSHLNEVVEISIFPVPLIPAETINRSRGNRFHAEALAGRETMAAPNQFDRRIAMAANANRRQQSEQLNRSGDLRDLHRVERAMSFGDNDAVDCNFHLIRLQ